MKKFCCLIFTLLIFTGSGIGQQGRNDGSRILFHGRVADASTLIPLNGTQIMINSGLFFISESDGTFAFYVNRKDTLFFNRLGYKSIRFYVSDTLSGSEFITGVFMHADTISIGEVVIMPRLRNLKNELLKPRPQTNTEIENAKYNVAVSAYIGKNSISTLGDPATNYGHIRQQLRQDAYEKGGILPSDKMVGLNPFILLPAAYLLIHGLPEKPPPLKPQLSEKEINQINDRYKEILQQRKVR